MESLARPGVGGMGLGEIITRIRLGKGSEDEVICSGKKIAQ